MWERQKSEMSNQWAMNKWNLFHRVFDQHVNLSISKFDGVITLNFPSALDLFSFRRLPHPNGKREFVYRQPRSYWQNLSGFCAEEASHWPNRSCKHSGRLHLPQSQNSITYRLYLTHGNFPMKTSLAPMPFRALTTVPLETSLWLTRRLFVTRTMSLEAAGRNGYSTAFIKPR